MVSQQTKKWFRNLNLHNDNVFSTRLEEVFQICTNIEGTINFAPMVTQACAVFI